VSCAKTAEPIEMQLEMLSRVRPGNMHYTGIDVDDPMRTGTFRGVWTVEKYCKGYDFAGWVGLCTKMDGPIITICTQVV